MDTKGRKKWRCIASIEAAKQGTEAREAYGRKISENNMAVSREKIKALLNPELKNQFSSEK